MARGHDRHLDDLAGRGRVSSVRAQLVAGPAFCLYPPNAIPSIDADGSRAKSKSTSNGQRTGGGKYVRAHLRQFDFMLDEQLGEASGTTQLRRGRKRPASVIAARFWDKRQADFNVVVILFSCSSRYVRRQHRRPSSR